MLSALHRVKSLNFFIVMFLPVSLLAFHHELDGYNCIKCGADISTLKSMQYAKVEPNKSNVTVYTKEGNVLTLGNASPKSIGYGFFDGRFFTIIIKVADLFNYILFKESVFEN